MILLTNNFPWVHTLVKLYFFLIKDVFELLKDIKESQQNPKQDNKLIQENYKNIIAHFDKNKVNLNKEVSNFTSIFNNQFENISSILISVNKSLANILQRQETLEDSFGKKISNLKDELLKDIQKTLKTSFKEYEKKFIKHEAELLTVLRGSSKEYTSSSYENNSKADIFEGTTIEDESGNKFDEIDLSDIENGGRITRSKTKKRIKKERNVRKKNVRGARTIIPWAEIESEKKESFQINS